LLASLVHGAVGPPHLDVHAPPLPDARDPRSTETDWCASLARPCTCSLRRQTNSQHRSLPTCMGGTFCCCLRLSERIPTQAKAADTRRQSTASQHRTMHHGVSLERAPRAHLSLCVCLTAAVQYDAGGAGGAMGGGGGRAAGTDAAGGVVVCGHHSGGPPCGGLRRRHEQSRHSVRSQSSHPPSLVSVMTLDAADTDLSLP
jgi:hypothetical protein